MTTEPRIYVACLAAYNNGKLYGKWIDANQDVDALHGEIAAMLAASPEPGAEEWSIHDHEGFKGAEIGENPDLEYVSRLAELLATSDNAELLIALDSHLGGRGIEGLEAAKDYLDEHYQGAFPNLEEWAYQFAMDTQGKDALGPYESYIDWERVGRDAEMGGDIFTIELDGETHVFWSR